MKIRDKFFLTPLLYFIGGLAVLLAGGGCASSPTFRGWFEQRQGSLSAAEGSLLVDTLRVISLLEEYCSALEKKDMPSLLECYSPGYSYYDDGLEWREQETAEMLFSPFARLEAAPGEISIEFVRKGAGHWLRQEDLSWLRSPRGERSPARSYRITLPGEDGPLELLLEPPGVVRAGRDNPAAAPARPRSGPDPSPGPVPVRVSSLVDPGVERPLGEVAFRLLLRGRLEVEDGSGELVSTLRERVIFLLEKEDGDWKIVSRW